LIHPLQKIVGSLLLLCSTFASANGNAQEPSPSAPDVRTVGHIAVDANGWHATWPGVYWVTQFEGHSIGITIDDARSGYTVEIDGKSVKTVEAFKGEHTIWVGPLREGKHQLRLIRRNESPELAGTVKAFSLDEGRWLPLASRKDRQIEFIGDSFTAGLANLSTKRACSGATVQATTDAGQAFGVLVARHYGADWELNAMSGMGMNRNWNGNKPTVNFRDFYPRLLQTDDTIAAYDPEWKPQLLVIGLGINDFSTPVHDGENWTKETLAEQFKTSYVAMIADLRARYGPIPILATAVRIHADDQQPLLVKQVVDAEQENGDQYINYVEYSQLQLDSCQWHPSVEDHRHMARTLIEAIDTLGIFSGQPH
jgi:lysophospholipase L1-like esterase